MSTLQSLLSSARLVALFGALLVLLPSAKTQEFEALNSKASKGYVRTRLPDGSYLPETYALKEGTYWGGLIAGDSIDTMPFSTVAEAIERALARNRYVPAVSPKTTKLMIIVDWGTASPPAALPQEGNDYIGQLARKDIDYAKENRSPTANMQIPGQGNVQAQMNADAAAADRFASQVKATITGKTNNRNAAMMGYPSADDSDLQYYRYFIVLKAYDFQEKSRHNAPKPLWEARFSIGMRGNEFGKQLAAMLQVASPYFGRNSEGLKREQEPRGHVEIGDLRYVGFVPDPNRATLAPDGIHVAYLRTVKSELRLVIADIDQPRQSTSVDISTLASQPIRLAWADAGHILVEVTSTDSLCFSVDGNSVKLNEDSPGLQGPRQSRGAAAETSPADLQALLEKKLPHRKVVVLESDNAARRFLLVASRGGGSGRFFILDRPNDLLYEVNRSDPTP